MVIGIDGKRAFFNQSGLGNYSRFVIKALLDSDPEIQIICFLTKTPKWVPDFVQHNRFHIVFLKGGNLKRFIGFGVEIEMNGCDVYWGLSNELPIGRKAKGVDYWVTIHDVIFERFPSLYSFWDRIIYRFKTQRSLKRADRIIAVSNQTKQDIIHWYHADPAKIEIIGQGCDHQFQVMLSSEEIRITQQKYHLENLDYIVQVGTVEERKNGELMIRALAESKSTKHLVFVGKKTSYQFILEKIAQELQIQNQVHFINHAIFSDLPALYQGSKGSAYVSKYEGFGIPVLESLYSEIPTLLATGSCLEETGGPCVDYIAPDDVTGAAQWILELDQKNKPHPSSSMWLSKFSGKELAKSWLKLD